MLSAFGYRLGSHFFRIVLSPFTRRRVIGGENIPPTGPAIIAPNHISHFDPPLLGISTDRQIDWMAMEELFAHPVLAAVLRWMGSFPVGRSKMDYAAVRTAIAPLKPGVAALAQMTQAPVIPCAVIGTDALYNPSRWFPWRHTSIWIAFGPPLAPPFAGGNKSAARESFEHLLGQKIRELYARTVREEHIPEDSLPQTPQKRKGRAL